MAVQGIWSGTISFSLVAIPVRLVTAVEPGRVSFRLLHNKDYSPLARRMLCPKEETTVSRDEMTRGFEIAPDQYVLMTDEELESVSPERSRTIEIVDFIDIKEVDPVYYDHPYYIVPSKGVEKAYRLLTEVLRRADKAGLDGLDQPHRNRHQAETDRPAPYSLHSHIIPLYFLPPTPQAAFFRLASRT